MIYWVVRIFEQLQNKVKSLTLCKKVNLDVDKINKSTALYQKNKR